MRSPQQQRSQQTTGRILDAARALLQARTLDELAVAEIAGHAGVSIGGFYARFSSKEDVIACLCDEAFLQLFVREAEEMLTPARWAGAGIEDILTAFHTHAVRMFRTNRFLLREVARLSRTSADQDFRARMGRFNRDIHQIVRRVLLDHSGEIGHPAPSVAIDLGMVMVSALMREVIFFADLRPDLHAISDDALIVELTRIFCGYLGVPAKAEAATGRTAKTRSRAQRPPASTRARSKR